MRGCSAWVGIRSVGHLLLVNTWLHATRLPLKFAYRANSTMMLELMQFSSRQPSVIRDWATDPFHKCHRLSTTNAMIHYFLDKVRLLVGDCSVPNACRCFGHAHESMNLAATLFPSSSSCRNAQIMFPVICKDLHASRHSPFSALPLTCLTKLSSLSLLWALPPRSERWLGTLHGS